MQNLRSFLAAVFAAVIALVITGCGKSDSGSAATSSSGSPPAAGAVRTIGVAFETLQTEFWVAGFDKLKADCAAKGITMLEGVADSGAHWLVRPGLDPAGTLAGFAAGAASEPVGAMAGFDSATTGCK